MCFVFFHPLGVNQKELQVFSISLQKLLGYFSNHLSAQIFVRLSAVITFSHSTSITKDNKNVAFRLLKRLLKTINLSTKSINQMFKHIRLHVRKMNLAHMQEVTYTNQHYFLTCSMHNTPRYIIKSINVG